MEKDVILTICGGQYSFIGIKARSAHAPKKEIPVSELAHCQPTGIKRVDNTNLRVAMIGSKYQVLTGYVTVSKAIFDSVETIEAKVMSANYLESTLVAVAPKVVKPDKPIVKPVEKKEIVEKKKEVKVEPAIPISQGSMIDKFKSAGYSVQIGNKML